MALIFVNRGVKKEAFQTLKGVFSQAMRTLYAEERYPAPTATSIPA